MSCSSTNTSETGIKIVRYAYTDMGVFGELSMPEFACETIERGWSDNEPFVSCIPVGEYTCELGRYNRGGYPTLVLKDVPGRSSIKFHRANVATELQGCIGLGDSTGCVNGKWAVLNSRKAFGEFWEAVMAVWSAGGELSTGDITVPLVIRNGDASVMGVVGS